MGKEIYIPEVEQMARADLEGLVASTPFLRSEIVNPDRLEAAREILQKGMGLCIVANHFSQGETVLIYQIPFRDPELRKRKVVAALAAHQKRFFMDPLSDDLGVTVKYIITKETVRRTKEKRKPIPVENEGAREFMNDALKTLSGGGIAIIFPQATRRETLYPPDYSPDNPKTIGPRTIGQLMFHSKKNKVRLGFLFVGVDLAKEVEDYSKVRGFNFFKKYKLTIGNTLTDEELLTQAGGKLGKVDEIAYNELAGLVSPKYASG